MACETMRSRRGQTLTERKAEIKQIISFTEELIAKGKVTIVVDKKTGAISFNGMTPQERGGVTDACTFRMISAGNSFVAKQAIQKAELAAGRQVNRQALGLGYHSHDGGRTFSTHKH